MSAKKSSKIPAAAIALYDKLIATIPGIERKGATVPYTSTNGRMFTYLSPTGELRLRLPEDERHAFQKRYRTRPPLSGGVVMKDWVAVPRALLARTAELKRYFASSRAYAERSGRPRRASAAGSRAAGRAASDNLPARRQRTAG